MLEGEMVQEQGYQHNIAAAGNWAEAWGSRAYLLVSFFLIVGKTLSASILGIAARNCD